MARADRIGETAVGGQFGPSIALTYNGDRVVIGAPYSSHGGNKGELCVFDWVNSSWSQMGTLIIGASQDFFGSSVAMSSDGRCIVATGFQRPFMLGNENSWIRWRSKWRRRR